MTVNESITLPPGLLKRYIRPNFVETGTFDGRTVQMALDCGCETVYSIETDMSLYSKSLKRFYGMENVHLYNGDSLDMLPIILDLLHEPALFWLDAHCQESYTSGRILVPVLAELLTIANNAKDSEHTILIDDMRLIGIAYGWEAIKLTDIYAAVLDINNNYDISFADSNVAENDILVARIKGVYD